MKYRRLGRTDLDVSMICLGTMTFGEQNSQTEAFEQMDYAVEQGVNFFDTAEMYAIPPHAETYGRTEEIIGTWFSKRKNRDKIILASKVAGPGAFVEHIRGGKTNFNLKTIRTALEGSLKRLQTDYVDVYQIHWPERNTNYFGELGYSVKDEPASTTIEETLEALSTAVKEGKARYIGISNETPWAVSEYLRIAHEKGLERIVSIQNPYNLLNRTFEIGLAEFSHRSQVGLLAYSPMAFGALSGKYLNGAKPEGTRLTRWSRFGRYTNPNGIKATELYASLAKAYGLTPAKLALAFVNAQPFVTSNIIGATKMDQLKENLATVDIGIDSELHNAVNTIHKQIPNPCP